MKKLVYFVISAAVVVGFSSCGSCSNNGKATTEDQATMPGSDRDEHGCIGSAGYQWSEVRQDCIRVFEEGIRMNDLADPEATSSAFVVLAKDSVKAELFMADGEKVILTRGEGDSAWQAESWTLTNGMDGWVVTKGADKVYSENKE